MHVSSLKTSLGWQPGADWLCLCLRGLLCVTAGLMLLSVDRGLLGRCCLRPVSSVYLHIRSPTKSLLEGSAWLKSPSVKNDPSDVLTMLERPEEMLSSEAEPQLLTMEPVTERSRSPVLEAGVCSSPGCSSLSGEEWAL